MSSLNIREADLVSALGSNALRGKPLNVQLLLTLVLVIDGFDLTLLGLLAPSISADFGLGVAEIGWILGCQQAAVALGGIVGGIIGDKFGRRRAIVLSTVLFSLGTLLAGLASTVGMFVCLRVLAGFGIGAISPNIASYLTEVLPVRWRGRLTSAAFVALSFGALGGAGLVVLFEDVLGWRGLFILGGGVPLLYAACLYWFVPESPLWMLSVGKPCARIITAANQFLGNTPVPVGGLVIRTEKSAEVAATEDSGFLMRLFRAIPVREVVSLYAIIFSLQIIFTAVSHMGPTVFTTLDISLEQAAAFMMWFTGAGVVGALTTIVVLPHTGSRFIYRVLGLGIILGFSGLWYEAVSVTPSLLMLSLWCACIGFNVNGLMLIGFPLAAYVYPTSVRSAGVGVAVGIGRIGSILAPAGIGAMIFSAGAASVFILGALVAIALVIASLALRGHIPKTSGG